MNDDCDDDDDDDDDGDGDEGERLTAKASILDLDRTCYRIN